MTSPPGKENVRCGVRPTADSDEAKGNRVPHNTGERKFLAWSCPPDDRDGFELSIGERGGLVLKQDRPFMETAVIVLHPSEARTLRQMLPPAIAAALAHRKATRG